MRKNFDRYYGVSEQELYQRSLDDLVDFNLDIIFVNISPGLYSVFKGNHYSGPGNHFCKLLDPTFSFDHSIYDISLFRAMCVRVRIDESFAQVKRGSSTHRLPSRFGEHVREA